MAARGSRFSTVLNWFRNADSDEVRAIMPLIIEACGERHITIDGRRPTVQRRHRRTKAEIAASRLNGPDTTVIAAGA